MVGGGGVALSSGGRALHVGCGTRRKPCLSYSANYHSLGNVYKDESVPWNIFSENHYNSFRLRPDIDS